MESEEAEVGRRWRQPVMADVGDMKEPAGELAHMGASVAVASVHVRRVDMARMSFPASQHWDTAAAFADNSLGCRDSKHHCTLAAPAGREMDVGCNADDGRCLAADGDRSSCRLSLFPSRQCRIGKQSWRAPRRAGTSVAAELASAHWKEGDKTSRQV